MKLLLAFIKRDLRCFYKQLMDVLLPILFFMIVVSIFPLAVAPDKNELHKIAPGILWMSVLLSMLLALPRLLRDDYCDGTLEQWVISGQPLELYVYGKFISYWCSTILPLLMLTPLFGIMLYLTSIELRVLIYTLLLSTPILSLIGLFGTTLTVHARQQGVLLTILILPLSIPIIVFSANAVILSSESLSYAGPLALLAALLCFSVLLFPLLCTYILRHIIYI